MSRYPCLRAFLEAVTVYLDYLDYHDGPGCVCEASKDFRVHLGRSGSLHLPA